VLIKPHVIKYASREITITNKKIYYSIPSITKNDNKTAHEFKAISLHFTTEIVWGFMYTILYAKWSMIRT
jgi:hypothetical protein